MCIRDRYLADADAAGKKVLFEAQLGALRDIDFGIYPYTTSSNVIGAYAVSYTHLDVYKRQSIRRSGGCPVRSWRWCR